MALALAVAPGPALASATATPRAEAEASVPSAPALGERPASAPLPRPSHDPAASGPWRGGWVGPEEPAEPELEGPPLEALEAAGPRAPRLGQVEPEAAASEAAASPPHRPPTGRGGRFTVLFSGQMGGLGERLVGFEELGPFSDPQATVSAGPFAGRWAYRQGPLLAFSPGRLTPRQAWQSFWSGGGVRLQAAPALSLVETDRAFVASGAWPGRAPEAWLGPWLGGALREGGFPEARVRRVARFVATRGTERWIVLSLDGKAPPLSRFARPEAWDRVESGELTAHAPGAKPLPVWAMSRPYGSGPRRLRLWQTWAQKAGPQLLRVDLGNALEVGGSPAAEAQRQASLGALKRLGLDLLVPGPRELSLGPEDWARLSEAAGVVLAANLSTKEEAWRRPEAWCRRRLAGVDVGVVGLVDDQALRQAGLVGPGLPWQAIEPLGAGRQAVEAAWAAGCDLVLVATNLKGQALQSLRGMVGVTAILADFQPLPGNHFEQAIHVTGGSRPRQSLPLLLASSSPSRVGRLTLAWEQGPTRRLQVVSVASEAQLVGDGWPADPALALEREALADRAKAEGQAVVLPAPQAIAEAAASQGLSLPPRWTEASWSLLMAKALRRATGAEVGVFRRRPVALRPPGPIDREALALRWLREEDPVVAVDLKGSSLRALAKGAQEHWVFAGYDPEHHRLDGRAVVDDERLRVALPAGLAWEEPWGSALEGAPRHLRWQEAGPASWRAGPQGQALPVALAVSRALEAWGEQLGGAQGPAFAAALARALSPDETPEGAPWRWVVRLDDWQGTATRVAPTGQEAYGAVRNSRVNAPASWALGLKGRASMALEQGPWTWEGRMRAAYRRVTLQALGKAEQVQEAEDEVSFFGEGRRYLGAWDGPAVYANSNVVTEFLPDPGKPRRLELNAESGLALGAWGGLSSLRLGGVLRNDLANPNRMEPGGRLEAGGRWPLAPWRLPGELKLSLEATHYLPVPGDGADRLGSLVNAVGTYALPLGDHLKVEWVADALAFRGKGGQDPWGSNLELRVGLGLDLGYKPLTGLWF